MKKFFAVGLLALFVFLAFPVREAEAVAQWTRKYKVNCQTCHTAFPRLTYFGEKFVENGYQMPGSEDGDETKEEINKDLFIDNLTNMFGLRISVSPAAITTNGLTNSAGQVTTKVDLGNTNWVQLFTAGSIFKNASIFIETEIENTSVHNNWFTLGYHNIFGQKLINFRIGKLSALNWHAMSGRLRMIPNIQVQGLRNVRSSGGATASATFTIEDQVNFSSPQAGLELYGYKGPFLYSVGVVNGSGLTDNNEFKNVFGTLRLEATGGPIEGSSISGWGYWGTDTGFVPGTSIRRKDRFYRASGAANLRWKKLDFIGSYFFQHDDNWTLAAAGPLTNNSHIFASQLGYLINPKWFAAGQWDYVTDSYDNSSTVRSNYYNKVSPSIWFMPRENMRIGFVTRFELRDRANGRQNEFLFNVRSMF